VTKDLNKSTERQVQLWLVGVTFGGEFKGDKRNKMLIVISIHMMTDVGLSGSCVLVLISVLTFNFFCTSLDLSLDYVGLMYNYINCV